MIGIHDSWNTEPINTLYAVVTRDRNGHEGICARFLPSLGCTPMVTGKEHLARAMLEIARETLLGSDKTIHLLKFTRSGEIEAGNGKAREQDREDAAD
jgi:hypothetical protein